MSKFQRILCPVDLSKESTAAIDLATQLAKAGNGKVIFIYVAPQWVTESSIIQTDYVQGAIEADRHALHEILPSDPSVLSEHLLVFGNAGPEIVRVSPEVDVIVMNTHGYTGLKRFLMGSVAEYVTRYAECPVITLKTSAEFETGENVKVAGKEIKRRFVTEIMHHVAPIHAEDKMLAVISELRASRITAAPVVDSAGQCVGILTETDTARFLAGNDTTATVEQYQSSPVVMILDSQTCRDAFELFQDNPKIHHLVVVNHQQRPLGMIDSKDVGPCA